MKLRGIFTTSLPQLGTIPQLRRLCAALGCLALPVLAAAQSAPVVDSFTADPVSVAPGGVVSLAVQAHDPDCPDVCSSGCSQVIRSDMTAWSATGGTFLNQDIGVTGSPYTTTTDWQAPASEGLYTIEVSLSDNGNFMCGDRKTTVTPIQIQVTSTPNLPPIIASVNARPAQLFPGEQAQLSCFAADPEGTALSYSWDSSLGSITPGAGNSATFLADDPGIVTITCMVSDEDGGSSSDTTQLSVSDAVAHQVLSDGLVSPQRLAVDPYGMLFVVDRGIGGLTAMSLDSGQALFHLPLPGLGAVATDWDGNLLIADAAGTRVIDHGGLRVLTLDSTRRQISDVAVDPLRRRYAALERSTARITVYSDYGDVVSSFGSTGDGAGQLKGPQGLAFAPDGSLVVADTGHGRLLVFSIAGTLLAQIGGPGSAVGELVLADDVAVDSRGIIFVSDSYQDWVQSFNPDGSLREVLGTWGDGPGRFRTATGLCIDEAYNRLLVASLNGAAVQVFRLEGGDATVFPAADVWFSADRLDFGYERVGTLGDARQLTLSNTGSAPLGVQEIGISGPFEAETSCAAVLDPGAWCAVTVRFRPGEAGAVRGWLGITTSSGGLHQVDLIGTGTLPPKMVLSAARLDFPDQAVGTWSDSKRLSLLNIGTETLQISEIRVTGPFQATSSCGSMLPGSGACLIDVVFIPTVTGDELGGSLSVLGNAPSGPGTVVLEGRAVLRQITPDPAVLVFSAAALDAPGSSRSVVFSNTGSDIFSIAGSGIQGSHPEDFAVTASTCGGAVLHVAETCTMTLSFTPSVNGLREAELWLLSADGLLFPVPLIGGEQAIFTDGFESGDTSQWSRTVGGSGKALQVLPGELQLAPGELGGDISVQQLTVLNHGDTPLLVQAVRLTADEQQAFLVTADACTGTWLEAKQRCMVELGLRTMDPGVHRAVIEVIAASHRSWQVQVPLSGEVAWPGRQQ